MQKWLTMILQEKILKKHNNPKWPQIPDYPPEY